MESLRWVFALTLLLGLGQATGQDGLPQIVPVPQEMEWTSGTAAWLSADALTGVAAPPECAPAEAALARLRARLGIALPAAAQANLHLKLEPLPGRVPARTRKEGYVLAIDAKGASLTAETPHGIHNGLVSLAQLATADGRIPCVTICDWPDLEWRGTYAPGIDRVEERFDQFVALKLNMLVLEDGKLYDITDPAVRARFEELATRCRANFIEFVPELQSLGWGHFVLQREPRAVEAHWMQDVAVPVKNGHIYAPDPPLPGPVSVADADFESGMQGWTADALYGSWRRASSEEAAAAPTADGGHALRLALAKTGSIRVGQDVAVQRDARYEMRCRIKTENAMGIGAYIEVYGVRPDNSLGRMLARNSLRAQGDSDWAEHFIAFETSPGEEARPGGALLDEQGAAAQKEAYERVRLFMRLEQCTGVAFFDDVSVRPLSSPNQLGGAVVTDAAKVVIQNADKTMTFEEGRDYALKVPALQYPFGPREPIDVTLTPDSRIKEGDTVLVSFNQAREGDITCCPSEPLYQAFMRTAIRNVVDALRPKYLHIGHDEPRFFNRDQRCADAGLGSEGLFVEDIKRTRGFALEADAELRIMMWDDAINPYQNAPNLGAVNAAQSLPRDIIVNIWWYDNDQWEDQMDKSLAHFIGLGFEVTGSPWFRMPNAYHWAELFARERSNPKAMGIIYTSWEDLPNPWGALEFTAEHMWSFGKPPYSPETPAR